MRSLKTGITLESILSGIYIVLYIAVMFCGNTFLLDYSSGLMAVEMVFIAAMVILKLNIGFINKKYQMPFILLLSFVVFMLFQLDFAYHSETTLIYIKRYIIYALLLIFVANSDMQYKTIRAVRLYSFVAAGSILIEAIFFGTKAGGLLGNFQAAGMMMSVAASVFFIDYFLTSNKSDIVGIMMSVLALLTSGKRMFFILVIVGFLITYYLTTKVTNKTVKKKFWAILILSSIAFGVAVYKIPQFQMVFERFADLSGASMEETTSGRTILWERAIYVFEQNKLTGIGFANFGIYFGDMFRNTGADAYLTHNIYYGLLAETGIIGFAIMLSFMLSSFFYSVYIFFKTAKINNFKIKYIMIYSLMIQIWFIIYGFTGNGIYDTNEFFFYVMAIAAVHSVRRTWDREKYKLKEINLREDK